MTGLGLKGLLKNISATFTRQLAAALFGLMTTALIARTYGPEVNGKMAIALLVPTMLATLLNLGISPANVYFLASGLTGVRGLLVVNLRIFLMISSLGLLAGIVILNYKSNDFLKGVDLDLLWFALAMFPLTLLNSQLISFFQGLQKFKPYNLLAIIQPCVVLIIVLSLIFLENRDLKYLIVAQIIGQIIVLLLCIRWILPLLKNSIQEGLTPSIKISQILKYGYKAHLGNIITFINYKADIFLANYFAGPVQVGVYVISVALSEKLWMLSQAVSTVLLPRLSQLSSDENKRKALTPLVSRWVFFVSLCAGSILAMLANSFIGLVFGPQYIDSLIPLYVLLPGIIVMSSSRVLANDIAARGRPDLNMFIALSTVVVNIFMNLLLIPRYGLAGAALSTTLSYVLDLILRLISYQRFTGIFWYHLLFIKAGDIRMLKKIRG